MNEEFKEKITERNQDQAISNSDKKLTYQQHKNKRFKEYKKRKGYKRIWGIKNKKESKRNEALMTVLKEILDNNGLIDIKKLFKTHQIWF